MGSVGVGICVGLLINKFSSYDPIKQGIIAGIISTFVLFINLRKLWSFTMYTKHTFTNWFSRLYRNRTPTNAASTSTGPHRF